MTRWVPAAFMRGGTSKGVFFREDALPPRGSERDALFLAVIGSPDPFGRQLDGMGGGISSLSKVVSVQASTQSDADVEYTFGQVAVDKPVVDYSANCGNLSAAVGPFAVDHGLVPTPRDGDVTLRLYNTNTGAVIHSTFAVHGGAACQTGDFTIPGVAGTGAPVRLDYLAPGGSTTGSILPAGTATTDLSAHGIALSASCVDAAIPLVIVAAEDLGLTCAESVETLSAGADLMARLDACRRAGAVAMGMAEHSGGVPLASPKIAVVGPPTTYPTLSGQELGPDSHDVSVRVISMEQVHRASPGTAALCLAVAARIPGSVVQRLALGRTSRAVRLGTPSGVITVEADVDLRDAKPRARSASMYRTARTLMRGEVAVDGLPIL